MLFFAGHQATAQDATRTGLTEAATQVEVVSKDRGSPDPLPPDPLPPDPLPADPLPPGAIRRFGTNRFQHPGGAVELALAPDERSLVSLGEGKVLVWDVDTGKLRWQARLEESPSAAYGVRGLAFLDADHFLTCGRPGVLLRWSLIDGKNQEITVSNDLELNATNRPIGLLPGSFRSVDVSRDGNQIAAAGAHGVVVCDREGKGRFQISNRPRVAVDPVTTNTDRLWLGGHYCLAIFSPNGQQLAIVASEEPKRIRLVDGNLGDVLIDTPTVANVVRFQFSPDGNALVTTERDTAIRQYSVATGKLLWEQKLKSHPGAESYASAIAYRPDGQLVLVATAIGSDNWLMALDSHTGNPRATMLGHAWKPWALATTADSKRLYSTGWDGAIRLWSLESMQQLDPPEGVRGSSVITGSADGDRLAFADDFGRIHVVAGSQGGDIQQLSLPQMKPSQLLFSKDNSVLVCGGSTAQEVVVAVWSLPDGQLKHHFHWPKGNDPHATVDALSMPAVGKRIAATCFRQNKIFVWDITQDQSVVELIHPSVYGASFHPDGSQLVSAGWDKMLHVWDAASGKRNRSIEFRDEPILRDGNNRAYHAIWSPVGDRVACAHMDGRVTVWSVDDWKVQRYFDIGARFVFGSIAFSEDGKWIVVGDADGQVSIWDSATGTLMNMVGRHEAYVHTVCFTNGGRAIASGGREGIAYCWNIVPAWDASTVWNQLKPDINQVGQGIWSLVQSQTNSVAYIEQELMPVRSLVDWKAVGDEVPAEQAERRRRLLTLLVDKDEKVEFTSRAAAAIYALTRIESVESLALLRRLNESHPCEAIRELTTTAIKSPSSLLTK